MGAVQEIWIDACAIEDIPIRGSRIIKTSQKCIAIFRTIDNDVFALDDQCPHKKGPLSQGIVHGKSVTCPLHNWVFSLETGQAQGEDGIARTRKIKVTDGRVHILLTDENNGG